MKRFDQLLHGAARFVFGIGVGVALTSAAVIVSSGPALDARDIPPADVLLDPVIITITPERFAAERGDVDVPDPHFHPYGSGAQKV